MVKIGPPGVATDAYYATTKRSWYPDNISRFSTTSDDLSISDDEIDHNSDDCISCKDPLCQFSAESNISKILPPSFSTIITAVQHMQGASGLIAAGTFETWEKDLLPITSAAWRSAMDDVQLWIQNLETAKAEWVQAQKRMKEAVRRQLETDAQNDQRLKDEALKIKQKAHDAKTQAWKEESEEMLFLISAKKQENIQRLMQLGGLGEESVYLREKIEEAEILEAELQRDIKRMEIFTIGDRSIEEAVTSFNKAVKDEQDDMSLDIVIDAMGDKDFESEQKRLEKIESERLVVSLEGHLDPDFKKSLYKAMGILPNIPVGDKESRTIARELEKETAELLDTAIRVVSGGGNPNAKGLKQLQAFRSLRLRMNGTLRKTIEQIVDDFWALQKKEEMATNEKKSAGYDARLLDRVIEILTNDKRNKESQACLQDILKFKRAKRSLDSRMRLTLEKMMENHSKSIDSPQIFAERQMDEDLLSKTVVILKADKDENLVPVKKVLECLQAERVPLWPDLRALLKRLTEDHWKIVLQRGGIRMKKEDGGTLMMAIAKLNTINRLPEINYTNELAELTLLHQSQAILTPSLRKLIDSVVKGAYKEIGGSDDTNTNEMMVLRRVTELNRPQETDLDSNSTPEYEQKFLNLAYKTISEIPGKQLTTVLGHVGILLKYQIRVSRRLMQAIRDIIVDESLGEVKDKVKEHRERRENEAMLARVVDDWIMQGVQGVVQSCF